MGRPVTRLSADRLPETATAKDSRWRPPQGRAKRLPLAPLVRDRGVLAAVAAGVLTFTVAASALVWSTHGGKAMLDLDLTFSSNACCRLTVWVNDFREGPAAVLAIRPGERATYSVPIYHPHISRLRIDPGGVTGSSVIIHRVWVARGSSAVAALDSASLRRYGLARASSRPLAHGVEFRAEAPNPSLDSDVSLAAHASGFRLFLQKVKSHPLDYFAALIVIAAVLTLPLALASRRQIPLVVALLGALIAVRALPRLLVHLRVGDDVGEAVGYAVYSGFPKRHDQLVLGFTALAAVGVPALVLGAERLFRRGRAEAERAPFVTSSSRASKLLPLAVVALLAFFFVPDLHRELARARANVYLPDWDANNLLFWHYLQQRGLVPTKDFFYPYGLQYLFTTGLPWGNVIAYLSYMLFWTYLVVGTHLVLARFFVARALVLRFSFVSAILVSAVLGGFLPLESRYIGALSVVLMYGAIDPRRDGWLSWKRALLAAALAQLILFEAAQAIYTVPAIAFLVLVELMGAPWRSALRHVARELVTLAVPLATAVAVLALLGQLGGTIDFYTQVSAETIAWATPSNIVLWIARPDELSGFLYWAIPVTVALGTAGVLTRARPIRAAHALVAALGLLGFMMMQKQVVRPGIQTAIWLPAVYGLLLWLVIESSLARVRHRAALTALAGALGGLTVFGAGYEAGLRQLGDGPARLVRSLDALATDRAGAAKVDRTGFAPYRFAHFTVYSDVLDELRREPAVLESRPIWFLGDDSPIAMMLGLRWPYYFATYFEASPIDWQRKLVRQLEREPPALVVWNRESMIFDGVPNYVRDPLLFDWAIRNLAPEKSVGSFELLRPRRAGEPIRLAWWRSRLGDVVDLEHIPQYTHVQGGGCASVPPCRSYVIVDFADGGSLPSSASVLLVVGGLPFRVAFAPVPGQTRYVLDLDRLWFWPAAPLDRSVDLQSIGGATMSLATRRTGPGVLY